MCIRDRNQEWSSEMAQKNAVVDHNTLASSWGPISAHNTLASSWGPYQAGVAQQKAIDEMMGTETAARLAQQNAAIQAQNQQAAAAAAMHNAAAKQAHTGAWDAQEAAELEAARQALTTRGIGPNYGPLSGSARIGAGGVSDINALSLIHISEPTRPY